MRINRVLGGKLIQRLTYAVLIVNIMHLIHSKPFPLIQLLLLHRHGQMSQIETKNSILKISSYKMYLRFSEWLQNIIHLKKTNKKTSNRRHTIQIMRKRLVPELWHINWRPWKRVTLRDHRRETSLIVSLEKLAF